MRPTGGPELLNHFSVLIYPFRHDLFGGARHPRFASLEARWAPWCSRLNEHELAGALESSGFFLPYIRGLLFPEVRRLQEESGAEAPAAWASRLRDWAGAGLADFCRRLPPGCVLRLTCRPELARALGDFACVSVDHQGQPGQEVEARFQWVDALLFPCGMGFLLLKAVLAGERPGLGDLIQIERDVRLVHPPHASAPLPRLRFHASGEELTVPALLDYLTQGLVGDWAVPGEDRALFPAPSRKGPSYVESDAGRAYGERCRVLSYACIDLEKADDQSPGTFNTAGERLLFELAAGIGLGESAHNPMWVPAPEQAQRYNRENRIAFWRCWSAMVLKESFVFLATEDLPFTRRSLPRRVENEHLPLYLYVLYQKMQLFAFSTELMREVAYSTGQLHAARALAERFIAFRSRYWFNEVTIKPQGSDLYKALQQGLDVLTLYNLVTSSTREIKDHYEAVWARQVQRIKDALTYGGPVTVAAGAVRMCVGEAGPSWGLWLILAAVLLLAAGLVYCLRRGRFSRAWGRRQRGRRPGRLAALPRMRWAVRALTTSRSC
jgi:hypothetical protein